MDSSQALGHDNIGNLLLKFSLPAIVGMLVNALYNIARVQVVLIAFRDAGAEMGVSALRSLMRGVGLFAAVRTSSETIVLMSRPDEVSEALSNSLSLLAGGARIAMGGFHRLKDFRKS